VAGSVGSVFEKMFEVLLENLCTISKTNIEEHCFENHRMRMVEHEMKN